MVMVFVMLFVLFVRFLTHDSSVVLVIRTYILEVSQSGPPRLAPYPFGREGGPLFLTFRSVIRMLRVMGIALQRKFWRAHHLRKRVSLRRHVSKGIETSPPCCTPLTIWLTSMLTPLKSEPLAFSRLNGYGNTARWLALSKLGCVLQ